MSEPPALARPQGPLLATVSGLGQRKAGRTLGSPSLCHWDSLEGTVPWMNAALILPESHGAQGFL